MIVTNVDKLLKLLEEKKKTTVADAAKALNASEKQIEKIANYLMEEGVISVDYKLRGIDLMLKPKEEKKAIKLMPHRFKRPKKSITKEKPAPKKLREGIKFLVKRLSKKDLTETDTNNIQTSFEKIVSTARQNNFYNKSFFNEINEFYELIESKKILLLMNAYKRSKDKTILDQANKQYESFIDLQNKLAKQGYLINLKLKKQLKKALEEIAK